MKKILILLGIMLSVMLVSSAYASDEDAVKAAGKKEINIVRSDNIFNKTSDWFATIGKSDEEKEAIKAKRREERRLEREKKSAEKTAERAKKKAEEKAEKNAEKAEELKGKGEKKGWLKKLQFWKNETEE